MKGWVSIWLSQQGAPWPPACQGGYTPPNAMHNAWGVYPLLQVKPYCSSSGGGSTPPRVMRNAYASWYIMHIDGYACISMDMHAYPWICMQIHGYACIRDSSENTRIPLLRWFLMNCNYYKEKWKSRFDRKIEFWLGNTKSNRVFYWKPNMILWSLRSFWVERIDLNQS